jgi:hypothetical protein
MLPEVLRLDCISADMAHMALGPGASATLEYDIRAFGNGLTTSCGSGCGSTHASIGDPLHLSAVGGPDTISAAPVPEPETCALMLLGLGALALTARRRREVRPRDVAGHKYAVCHRTAPLGARTCSLADRDPIALSARRPRVPA